jgi:myosin heavy chain 6/7
MQVCAAEMLAKLVTQKDMEVDNFRVGHTKIFFKAGILAHMEDLRDEKIGRILSKFQAIIRWSHMQVC